MNKKQQIHVADDYRKGKKYETANKIVDTGRKKAHLLPVCINQKCGPFDLTLVRTQFLLEIKMFLWTDHLLS